MDKRTTEDILRNHDEINRMAAALHRESRDYIHMPRVTPTDRLMVAAVLDELTKEYALVDPQALASVEQDARIGKAVREWRNSIPILPGLLGFGYRQCLEKLDDVIAKAREDKS